MIAEEKAAVGEAAQRVADSLEENKKFIAESLEKEMAESCYCCAIKCRDWNVKGNVNLCSSCSAEVAKTRYPWVTENTYKGGAHFETQTDTWKIALAQVKAQKALDVFIKSQLPLVAEIKKEAKLSVCNCCFDECKDWQSPFDVNVCSTCASEVHNIRAGFSNPDTYDEGDCIDPISWKKELAQVRARATKEKEMLKTKCYCCAAECKDWNDKYATANTCADCAALVHKKKDADVLAEWYTTGDGFQVDVWKKELEEVKTQKSKTACHCCGEVCHDYKSVYSPLNACTTCATEVHKYYSPNVTEANYPNGDAFTKTTWTAGIEVAKAKAKARKKNTEQVEEIGQEVWVPLTYIKPELPRNLDVTCEQIFLPNNCPDCNQKVIVAIKGGKSTWGGMRDSCSHMATWNSLYQRRIQKVAETIDIWVDQSYLGIKEPGYKCKKIRIPKKCPGAACGSTFEIANHETNGEQSASYFKTACNCGMNGSYASLVAIKLESEQTREEFAEKIIASLKGHMYPFGGYLRDKEAGEEFKDIDLFFPKQDPHYRSANANKNSHLLLLDKLKAAGFKVESKNIVSSIYVEDSATLLNRQAYSIEDNFGNKIDIDVVNSSARAYQSASDTPFIALDADVNSLYRDINGKLCAANGYMVSEVIGSIQTKTFDMPKGAVIRADRIQSLLEKGYSPAKLAEAAPKENIVSVYLGDGKDLALDLNNKDDVISKITTAVAEVKEVAKERAFDSSKYYVQIGDEAVRVAIALSDAVLLNEKIEEYENTLGKPMFDMDKLCAGDRVLLSIEHEDVTYDMEASVITTDFEGNPVFCFDDQFETDDGALTSFDCPYALRDQAETLGLDPNNIHCWSIDEYTSTTVVKKLPKKKEGANAPEQETVAMINQDDGEEISFFDLLKSEMAEAGLEVTATQLTDGLQAGFMMLLKDRGFDEGELAVVKKMLGSKGGHAVLSWAIGMGILNINIEGITDIPAVQVLGKKFRVGGMREIGNEGAAIAKQYFMPAIMGMISSIPKITEQAALAAKTRIGDAPATRVGTHEELEEEVDLSSLQSATAR